ncbi:hypothetical protein G5714_006309 [Onychostoma macrolepis]|uniref:Uncharacterized protein n=1 Tax=Onychostoma macrolepis TaxID=369639 RepID=A0A7J6D3P5_9TELE|nr:hypothetical protein G5714_006309 [Onychostoma macrolepis]
MSAQKVMPGWMGLFISGTHLIGNNFSSTMDPEGSPNWGGKDNTSVYSAQSSSVPSRGFTDTPATLCASGLSELQRANFPAAVRQWYSAGELISSSEDAGAVSYPFTADKLKAKSSIGVFLSMDLSTFGHNLEYCWNPGSPLKD